MAYEVRFKSSARRAFDSLARQLQARILAKIDPLAENPRPIGSKKLAGPEDRWRIRVGDFRVIYEIHDQVLVVLVIAVGHRRDVYR